MRFSTTAHARYVVGLCLLAAFTYSLSRRATAYAQGAREIQVQPFSCTLTTMSYRTKQSGELSRKLLYSRRSDGSVCTRTTEVTPLSASTLRKVTFSDGQVVVAGDDQKMRSTIYLTDVELARHKDSVAPKAGCPMAGEASAEGGSIADRSRSYPLERWRSFSLNAESRMTRITRSRVPELGCFTASTVEEVQNPDGSFSKVWEERNDGLVDGEPPPSDFQIPDTYAEVPPSTLLKLTRWADVYSVLSNPGGGLTVPAASLERIELQLAQEDAAYYAAHRK